MSTPEALSAFLLGACVVLAIWRSVYDYQHSPMCRWCQIRHRGRCIYNPRSGRIFANVNDGHFDYDDPNQ